MGGFGCLGVSRVEILLFILAEGTARKVCREYRRTKNGI